MTICAATMHADIRLVLELRSWSASFWPTSGSMAALAKWNRTAQAAKISNGRQVIRTLKPDGCSRSTFASPSNPRARS
jgi:hypothetical protein